MYFKAVIEEINGEQRYSYDYLVKASSFRKAQSLADNYAKSWYGESSHKEDGWYMHLDGTIAVRVRYVVPVTVEEFLKEILTRFTIEEKGEGSNEN